MPTTNVLLNSARRLGKRVDVAAQDRRDTCRKRYVDIAERSAAVLEFCHDTVKRYKAADDFVTRCDSLLAAMRDPLARESPPEGASFLSIVDVEAIRYRNRGLTKRSRALEKQALRIIELVKTISVRAADSYDSALVGDHTSRVNKLTTKLLLVQKANVEQRECEVKLKVADDRLRELASVMLDKRGKVKSKYL